MRRRPLRRLIALAPSLIVAVLLTPAVASATIWSIRETPAIPKLEGGGVLQGVSCPSSESCTAAGRYKSASGAKLPLADRWNGKEWSSQELPKPTGATASELKGVSCSSSEACTAVGYYEKSGTLALAERWNGKVWSIQEIKTPTGAKSTSLLGVSCTSGEACTAVGWYVTSSNVEVPLAERWNGKEWSIQETKTAAGATESSLTGVSCTSSEACTAVGRYINSSSVEVPLAERWNGKEWSIQETKVPTGAKSSSLAGVSCTSSEACTAVGHDVNSSSVEVPLAERWNGKEWSIQAATSPKVIEASGTLRSVSCTSAKACSAVGFYKESSGYVPLAERWNGTTWSLQATPSVSEATSRRFSGVSCSAAESCIAVGEFSSGSGNTYKTLAEQWNGKEWSVMTTINTAELDNVLVSVSCSSAEACTAVGYDNGTGAVKLLAERWNGKVWTIEEPPTPKGENSELAGVSCSATEACTSVGWNVTGANVVAPLVERWNGKEWATQEAPKPKALSYLRGVSCPALEACSAVGDAYNTSEHPGPLAEHWNGKEWSVEETSPEVAEGGLLGISCVSTDACTAAGYRGWFTLEKDDESTLVQHWNGEEWAIEETSDPASAKSSLLESVSCVASGSCIAAGTYVNGAGVEVPLVEEN
jgi:hypothetical protein